MLSTLQTIDRLTDKGLGKEKPDTVCTSVSLLSMQQYYYYWSLCLLMCGDYSQLSCSFYFIYRSLKFARKSDRVYQTILQKYPSDIPPTYLPPFIIGTISDLVLYVKKTLDLVNDLQDKQRFDYIEKALSEVFAKAPYHYVLHTVVPRSHHDHTSQ